MSIALDPYFEQPAFPLEWNMKNKHICRGCNSP